MFVNALEFWFALLLKLQLEHNQHIEIDDRGPMGKINRKMNKLIYKVEGNEDGNFFLVGMAMSANSHRNGASWFMDYVNVWYYCVVALWLLNLAASEFDVIEQAIQTVELSFADSVDFNDYVVLYAQLMTKDAICVGPHVNMERIAAIVLFT